MAFGPGGVRSWMDAAGHGVESNKVPIWASFFSSNDALKNTGISRCFFMLFGVDFWRKLEYLRTLDTGLVDGSKRQLPPTLTHSRPGPIRGFRVPADPCPPGEFFGLRASPVIPNPLTIATLHSSPDTRAPQKRPGTNIPTALPVCPLIRSS
jgi:hypothetical protein